MKLPRWQLGAIACIAAIALDGGWGSNLASGFAGNSVLAQSSSDRQAEADQFYKEGLELFERVRLQAAWLKFKQALKIYREIDNSEGIASTLIAIGNINYLARIFDENGSVPDENDLAKILAYYQKAIEIRASLGNHLGVAEALVKMGDVYKDRLNCNSWQGYRGGCQANVARETRKREKKG